MSLVQILPWIAGVGFVAVIFAIAQRPHGSSFKRIWIVPALLSGLFLAWSLLTIFTEGLTGFWPEHTRNMWGNQIWFDLLLAAGVACGVIAPRAKACGMNVLLWFGFVLCTGSIGLLAMVSRLLFLEQRAAA